MKQRSISLDALRGLAILGMVLSSSIAFGILPAWMYHAQEPPPLHDYMPTLAGISWVDLVFPVFLFSLGAAIPLALHKYSEVENGNWIVMSIAFRRFLLLVYFSLFTFHIRPGSMSASPSVIHYLVSIFSFVLLFFQLYRPSSERSQRLFKKLKFVAFLLAVLLVFSLPYFCAKEFSLFRSDIIILVLANMVLFGTVIWWITRNNLLLRLAILPFLFAVLVGGKEPGTWNNLIVQSSLVPWLFKFQFLKYLFIIIPGTIAGEWMLKFISGDSSDDTSELARNRFFAWIPVLSSCLVLMNIIFLFNRSLMLNLCGSVLTCILLYFLAAKNNFGNHRLYFNFFKAGTFLLLLGLFFEAFEGGIKKDPSTFSYYFVSAGISFFLLLTFYTLEAKKTLLKTIKFLSLNGMNPMVAYVSDNLLLIPILQLSGLYQYYTAMHTNTYAGFLSGLIFTAIIAVFTIFCTKRRWIWRT